MESLLLEALQKADPSLLVVVAMVWLSLRKELKQIRHRVNSLPCVAGRGGQGPGGCDVEQRNKDKGKSVQVVPMVGVGSRSEG